MFERASCIYNLPPWIKAEELKSVDECVSRCPVVRSAIVSLECFPASLGPPEFVQP